MCEQLYNKERIYTLIGREQQDLRLETEYLLVRVMYIMLNAQRNYKQVTKSAYSTRFSGNIHLNRLVTRHI